MSFKRNIELREVKSKKKMLPMWRERISAYVCVTHRQTERGKKREDCFGVVKLTYQYGSHFKACGKTKSILALE